MPDTNNMPIRYGKYIDHDMNEKRVIFIGVEKAIYDSNGRKLDAKLIDMEDSLSDAFSTEKAYVAGDYCVYTNRVFKFTKAKAAGEWDGTAVIPVSLAQEISTASREIAALNSQLGRTYLLEYDSTKYITIPTNTDLNSLTVPGVYCCHTTAVAQTIENCPFKFAFKMIVEEISGDANIISQKIFSGNYMQFIPYIRTRNSANNWGEWYQFATKSDLAPLGNLRVKSFKTATVAKTYTISGPDYIPYLIWGQKGIGAIANGGDAFEASFFGNKPDNFDITKISRAKLSIKIPAYTNLYAFAMADFTIEESN